MLHAYSILYQRESEGVKRMDERCADVVMKLVSISINRVGQLLGHCSQIRLSVQMNVMNVKSG